MVFLCIACIVLSSIALHGIALHRIAWHCIAFDYLSWYCMVLHRLHGVVQLIWRAGELPRSASSHFSITYRQQISTKFSVRHQCNYIIIIMMDTGLLLKMTTPLMLECNWGVKLD